VGTVLGPGVEHLKEDPMKSPVILLCSLLNDMRRLHPDVKGLDRDYLTIERRFEDEGFSFLSKTLPILNDAIVDGIAVGRFTCPTNFSKVKGGSLPKLFKGLTSGVFDINTGHILENYDVSLIISLRQILLLYKRTIVDGKDSDKLSQQAADGFFNVESRILDLDLDPEFDFIIGQVSSHILPGLTVGLDDIEMKHGPGAVYEPVKGNQKWSLLCSTVIGDDRLSSYGYSDFALLDRISLSDIVSGEEGPPCDLLGSTQNASSSLARLVTVPKNSTSRRTISVEPMLNQFVQQGLNRKLRDTIRQCPIMRQCLDLTDQTKNQNLALIGSLTNKYATIDLKSASDLMSLKLVNSVFRAHGPFLDHAIDCRSESVQHEGRVEKILKFAGMGNALTFPIQSVVFAVLSIAMILKTRGEYPRYGKIKAAARRIRVYGDDIIIETEYAHQVVSGLTSAGLIVNTNKSFLNGSFKESCGTDYVNGVLVTPLYIKYHPADISRETRALSNFVVVSNRSWERCYYDFSTALKDLVESQTGPLPYVPQYEDPFEEKPDSDSTGIIKSSVLGWTTRRGDYSFQKWDYNLQRFLVRGPVIRSRTKRDILTGWPALLKFFHTVRKFRDGFFFNPIFGREKDHLERSPLRYRTAVRWRWVPV
jgi:hypothetical protein